MTSTCSFAGCGGAAQCKGLCGAHYQQQWRGEELKPVIKRRRGESPRPCSFRECDRAATKRGLCATHYAQQRRGQPLAPIVLKGLDRRCSFPDCGRRHAANGLCASHRRQQKLGQELKPIKVQGAGYLEASGYRVIRRNGKPIFEHRAVMEDFLGRPLEPHETVHHKYGGRADNRLERLELWSSSQPPGQRVVDKVAWAREILAMYGDLVDRML